MRANAIVEGIDARGRATYAGPRVVSIETRPPTGTRGNLNNQIATFVL